MSVAYVYDTGALVAAERGDRRMLRIHAGVTSSGQLPVVPAAVLAQAWRDGRRQARLAAFLPGCFVEPLDERIAKAAGVLLGRSATRDVVDATLVVTALRLGAVVVTSDPNDVQFLVDTVSERVPGLIVV